MSCCRCVFNERSITVCTLAMEPRAAHCRAPAAGFSIDNACVCDRCVCVPVCWVCVCWGRGEDGYTGDFSNAPTPSSLCCFYFVRVGNSPAPAALAILPGSAGPSAACFAT